MSRWDNLTATVEDNFYALNLDTAPEVLKLMPPRPI